MRKISAVVIKGIILVLIHVSAFCQDSSEFKTSVIESYPLSITYFKTTNLVFPSAIKSVDRGSQDVLAQKAVSIENVLQVKAAKKGFDETNLTVITADGKLYSYLINYADSPTVLNIRYTSSPKPIQHIFFSSATINEAEFREASEKIAGTKPSIHGKKDFQYGIKLQLMNLYVKEDVLYYQIGLFNSTYLNYDIDQFRFFIRDQKKSKRTASQELEVKPLFIYNDTTTVKGQSDQIFVFALSRFTIPDKKHLVIQVMEKNGGRNLEMRVKNRTIIKANPIN